jgi:hypothetical protein
MAKNTLALSAAILVFAASLGLKAQTRDTASVELNLKVFELAREGRLDDAIPVAKQVVDMQRRSGVASRNLATALENLSQLLISRFAIKERNSDERSADGKAAEECLVEALSAANRDAATALEQHVSIRNSLAAHLDNFRPIVSTGPSGFDRDSREKYGTIKRANYRERTEQARKLFEESIRISTHAGDPGSPVLALSLFKKGEFELANSELESAAELFEKCITVIQKSDGAKSRELLPPLRSYAKLLAATGQDEKAMDAISHIVRISGETTKYPKDLPNLTNRSPKAFTVETSAGVDAGTRAARQEAELKARHSAVLAGNTPNAALGTSTQNFEYYQRLNNTAIVPYFVRVVVDAQGKVSEADCFSCDELNKTKVERLARDWQFRPYTRDGVSLSMNGYITINVITDLVRS